MQWSPGINPGAETRHIILHIVVHFALCSGIIIIHVLFNRLQEK